MTGSLHSYLADEKNGAISTSPAEADIFAGEVEDIDEEHEVFKKNGEVSFRTVGWPRASVIFLKVIFATGVLSIPTAMVSLGAVGGSLNVIAWSAFNTYVAIIFGDFRNRHARCHSVADMAEIVGGYWAKELVGAIFIICYVLCAGSGILGVTVGLNALSHHAACTVWWTVLATGVIIVLMVVVIGVTTRDRPAAAPQTGPYELGYFAVPSGIPFAAGVAVYACMSLVTAAYLAFSLVVYKWCGKWVASPSLGSAGQTVKMVAFGVGLVGLIVSGCLYLHVSSKYLFVRILGKTRHLQENTWIHWGTWLSCTIGLGAIAFILVEAIPIFNYLIAIIGSVCLAPISIILPGWLWLYDHWSWLKGNAKQQLAFWFHAFFLPLGAFFTVAGTYGVIKMIIDAYASGLIGGIFQCADNSNSS
ncbi:uncharacterized protein MYCFIDRAFT_71783 [Pseudocercospora fijiensis CIRAD86]|uniref:Amino acid transporter transmembrane domain-containing protein n=1 Tax=Pseudocercospora fijiensis (strain CIRAD86) TaxID=383855 RepID=M3AWP2_PSEFD|nr:uncharacterized protein MYCFIDRAFT_71783 [Pseudocercospora fijiensis CIRAD86]EME81882.1 hypothetical protein MYCFIDRAFT_71783 [Pseudocercospora fijiensis CIRAD86]